MEPSPDQRSTFRLRLRSKMLPAGLGVAALALVAAGCSGGGSSSSSSSSSTSSGGKPVTGGTAVYAGQPLTPPKLEI